MSTKRQEITIYADAALKKQLSAHAKKAGVSLSRFIVNHLCADIARTGEMPLGLADTEALRLATETILETIKAEGELTRLESIRVAMMTDLFVEMFLQHTEAPMSNGLPAPRERWRERQAAFNERMRQLITHVEDRTNGR